MRITNRLLTRSVIEQIRQNINNLQVVQEQITTGKRINRPSDDPLGATQSARISAVLSANEQFIQNIGFARSSMQTAASAFAQIQEILSRASEIAVSQAGANANSETRAASAIEVRNLFEQAIVIANTKFGDQFVFAGHENLQPAFSVDGTYLGDSGVNSVTIAKGATIKLNFSGDNIFTSDAGGAPVFEILSGLEAALLAGDSEQMFDQIGGLESAHEVVAARLAEAGARINRLESTKDSLEQAEIDLQEIRSEREEVDLAEAFIRMAVNQNLLQASLASAARIAQFSLVNFL